MTLHTDSGAFPPTVGAQIALCLVYFTLLLLLRLYYECTFIQPCLKSVTYRLMQHYLERSQSEMHAGKAGNHNLKQE